MDREEILRQQTSKDDGLATGRRCFYALHHNSLGGSASNDTANHRTTKLLCLLIEQLENNGQLSADQIDDLLLGALGHDER